MFTRRIAFLSLMLVSALVVRAQVGAPPRVLRVLTYNIHHGEGVDGRTELTRLAGIISASNADVVALQEVDQKTTRTKGVDQAAELGALTGLNFSYGKAMDYQGGAYGQALLSRWPLEDFTVHPLPNPAKVEPRIAISAVVRPPGLPAVRVIGTHLDASRDDAARRQQAIALNDLFAKDDTLTLLLGDLNARPETPVIQTLFTVWADASIGTPLPTIPSKKPTGRIDYVLLRPAGVWRVISSTVLPEAVASDHRPLLVELVLVK
jgi:endonuclease/exonuclease/phosphatase family metal-dependent hydrolase